jgi:hypothetical protein
MRVKAYNGGPGSEGSRLPRAHLERGTRQDARDRPGVPHVMGCYGNTCTMAASETLSAALNTNTPRHRLSPS